MKDHSDKVFGFSKLIEAMKHEGCPICRCILEETRRAMESFLVERDASLNQQIEEDRGFCNRHSWELARCDDAFNGTHLFAGILENLLPRIGAQQGNFLVRKPVLAALGTQICIFCRREQQAHESMVRSIVSNFDEPELKTAWEGRARLCIPHLTDVLSRVDEESNRAWLLATHRSKYRLLSEQMRQFTLKHPVNSGSECGEEKTAWLRTIESLVGRYGIR